MAAGGAGPAAGVEAGRRGRAVPPTVEPAEIGSAAIEPARSEPTGIESGETEATETGPAEQAEAGAAPLPRIQPKTEHHPTP